MKRFAILCAVLFLLIVAHEIAHGARLGDVVAWSVLGVTVIAELAIVGGGALIRSSDGAWQQYQHDLAMHQLKKAQRRATRA